MSLVLDSSTTLAWIYADERTDTVQKILFWVSERGAWVPAIWRLEIANALEMGIRRRRIDGAFRDAMLSDLSSLPIRIDKETNTHAWGATLRLAGKHRLTLYDAAYLEVARRRGLPLATLDRELRAGAVAEGIRVL